MADDVQLPRVYQDSMRAQWASVASIVLVLPAALLSSQGRLRDDVTDRAVQLLAVVDLLLVAFALMWLIFTALYLVWTHRIFARMSPGRLRAVASAQGRAKTSLSDELSGLGGASSWSVNAAITAVVASVALMLFADRLPGLVAPALAIGMAVSSWLTMAYSFALRYARLDAQRPCFEFVVARPLRFVDYLSHSLMVSTLGGTAATPRTRAALEAQRTHTLLAFVFNAVVVALTVSLVVSAVSR
ncbi:MAG: DUF1345 domain-containing protein [Arachnia sp.]